MEIAEVDAGAYYSRFPGNHVFNSRGFVELNSDKCREVKHLLLTDGGKARLGLTLGLITGPRGEVWASPWSAPYGGFDYTADVGAGKFVEALNVLKDWASAPLKMTLPPAFHDPRTLPKVQAAWLNMPGATLTTDLNYHYNYSRCPDWEAGLSRETRNKWRAALRRPFGFERLKPTTDNIGRVYAVIEQNHRACGYPLRMSLEQVTATLRVVRADLFLATLEGRDVASALVYHVAPGVVQVIYWGDTVEARQARPMNYLSWKVMEHYRAAGTRIFDIGPASEAGVPNPGLCEFKEGLGCLPTLKLTAVAGVM